MLGHRKGSLAGLAGGDAALAMGAATISEASLVVSRGDISQASLGAATFRRRRWARRHFGGVVGRGDISEASLGAATISDFEHVFVLQVSDYVAPTAQ